MSIQRINLSKKSCFSKVISFVVHMNVVSITWFFVFEATLKLKYVQTFSLTYLIVSKLHRFNFFSGVGFVASS